MLDFNRCANIYFVIVVIATKKSDKLVSFFIKLLFLLFIYFFINLNLFDQVEGPLPLRYKNEKKDSMCRKKELENKHCQVDVQKKYFLP